MSRAPADLTAWLAKMDLTQAVAARLFQISRPQLTHLTLGSRKPSLALATRIERVTGIPAGSWHSDHKEVA